MEMSKTPPKQEKVPASATPRSQSEMDHGFPKANCPVGKS